MIKKSPKHPFDSQLPQYGIPCTNRAYILILADWGGLQIISVFSRTTQDFDYQIPCTIPPEKILFGPSVSFFEVDDFADKYVWANYEKLSDTSDWLFDDPPYC